MRINVQPEGWAIIDQTVKMSLGAGINSVSVACPREVDESSVLFDIIDEAEGVDILSHEFVYGPPRGTSDLLSRLVGREVICRLESGQTLSGKLLWSTPITMETSDGVVIAPEGTIVMKNGGEAQEILKADPHIEMTVRSEYPSEIRCKLSYQAVGFNWSSTQVCLLNEVDQTVDFHCWLGLSNSSGMDFRDVEISVVADSAGPQQISYRVGQKLDRWLDGSNLRVNLISATSCGASVVYTVPPKKEELWQTLAVINSEGNGLGFPFPPSDFVLLMRKTDGATNYLSHGNISAMYPNSILYYDFSRMLNAASINRTETETGMVTLGVQSISESPMQVMAREELRGDEILLNATKPPVINGPTSLAFPLTLIPRGKDGVNYYLRADDKIQPIQ